MSFRFERKALFHFSDYLELKKLIFKLKGHELYPKRQIKSLYFDNFNTQTFFDSEEGSVPRKKIRIRNYPKSKKKFFMLEKKISSVEGRFKLSKNLSTSDYDHFLQNGVKDDQYGYCFPIVWITYEREYFRLLENRVTIDKDIRYQKYNNSIEYLDNTNIIFEVKSNKSQSKNLFDNLPQFNEIRVSKYCNSIKKIFNIKY